jgi:hypothetical protein
VGKVDARKRAGSPQVPVFVAVTPSASQVKKVKYFNVWQF